MNTPTGVRVAALAKELRSAAEGTTGPEMHVWVRSGALLVVLDALAARHRASTTVASADRAGHAPHAINPLAHEQSK